MAGKAFTKLRDSMTVEQFNDVKFLCEQMQIDALFVLEGIREIAINGQSDRDKLKAHDMLSKFIGIKPVERIIVNGFDGLRLEFEKIADA